MEEIQERQKALHGRVLEMANERAKELRKQSHGAKDAFEGGMGGLVAYLAHPEGGFGRPAGPKSGGRVGRGVAGGVLSNILGSEVSDAAFGEEERGNTGYEALKGGIQGAGLGASLSGSAPKGGAILKHLIHSKGMSKGKALATLLGIPAAALGALGAGGGAIGSLFTRDYED